MKHLHCSLILIATCLLPACGGDEFSTGASAGTGGVGAGGGSAGSSGMGGKAGSGGSAGNGGTVADAGDEADSAVGPDAVAETGQEAGDGPTEADAAEEPAVDATAEDAAPDSSDAAEAPDAPWPTGPCGPIPPTGYAICWIYAHPVYPTMHVGLAGGVATPGHFIENEWTDPMFGNAGICVAATAAEDRILCTLDELPVGSLVQFAAGLHLAQTAPTDPSHWACDSSQCSGEVYVFHDGAEIGKYVGGQGYGKLHTIPHFVTANHLDLGFGVSL